MAIDPSNTLFFEWHFIRITATLVYTWIMMLLLVIASFLLTRNLKSGKKIGLSQNIVETLIETISGQIAEISQQEFKRYFPFVGTLFIFIFSATILSVVPGFVSPTGSLNTTIALSLCVFFAAPAYGIRVQGIRNYLKEYTKPSFIMLPFNIIGEFSRTISMAIRLYGNVMSSSIIIAILLGIIPLFFPIIMQLLGLLTGTIQAYIFAVLATVYIAAATRGK